MLDISFNEYVVLFPEDVIKQKNTILSLEKKYWNH